MIEMQSRVIQLTTAAFKYGNLNLRACGKEFFPTDVFGGSSRKAGMGKQVTLEVSGLGQFVKTDIPTDMNTGRPRWLFRERKWFREFLHHHKLALGDAVVIHRIGHNAYRLSPAGKVRHVDLFEDSLRPALYAQRLAEEYIRSSSLEYRKQRGQYFTPIEVADFMADLAIDAGNAITRILDPGAGLGILSCAVCERLVQNGGVREIELDAFETDRRLLRFLYEVLGRLDGWLESAGVCLKFNIIDQDFVLAGLEAKRSEDFRPYDLVVSNPPYMKIPGGDVRSRSLPEAAHGQPNLYGLFMLTAANLLRRSGSMVFITPRSYTSGQYFKAFRRAFFAEMRPVKAHVFDSRKDVFGDQSVLQENIILKAQKGGASAKVTISRSRSSNDLNSSEENRIPAACALWERGDDLVLRLPVDEVDNAIVQIVDSWCSTLSDYHLQISTGPVVPFRAREFIAEKPCASMCRAVPLIWMRNVRPMETVWPCDGSRNREARHQFIIDGQETRSRKLLVPNRNTVLLRRFSVKEEQRRLIASPLFREQLTFECVGIENHINYIYRPGSELSREEVVGLAALLNSMLLDRYFRICNGSTQVGAGEVRGIPLPPMEIIINLGQQLLAHYPPSLDDVDRHVWEAAKPFANNKSALRRVLR